MRSKTRLFNSYLNNRWQRRPEKIREKVRLFTILAKAIASRVHYNIFIAVFAVKATTVAVAAMATVVNSNQCLTATVKRQPS